ncbi:px domain-containing protein [Colletotrichum karsti]|uniref:Px domain-containing protein n=1 Tax=Colletotrichum karsti TaxID=1095194 RepID=A0A9P6IBL2_9PEZI|nr:px domain-containing protein [Colletotrichum karsti]KAF9879888.1 px domain-containing protein [Colletotrichum karsti]
MVFTRTPRSGGRRGGVTYNKSSSYGKSSGNWRSSGYGAGAGTPSSQKKRLDGLYLEGNWYCNCEPRLQAKYLETKKKGPNHGRWFFTCGGSRNCNFFLWEDDAKNRSGGNTMTLPPMPEDDDNDDEDAAKSSKTATPGPLATTTSAAAALPTPVTATPRQRSMGDYLTKPAAAAETPSRTAAKRKRVLFEFSDEEGEDEYGMDDVSEDEERQMNEAMERSAKKLTNAPPVTPSARRTSDEQVSTPGTVTRTLFPDAKRRNTGAETSGFSFSGASTSTSSTITAGGPSSSPPGSQARAEEEARALDPTDEVMGLLRGKNVDEATMGEVRDVLRRFAMKAKGVARGRDSVRTALKSKDEKIAGLQERVASLETRNRVQREG